MPHPRHPGYKYPNIRHPALPPPVHSIVRSSTDQRKRSPSIPQPNLYSPLVRFASQPPAKPMYMNTWQTPVREIQFMKKPRTRLKKSKRSKTRAKSGLRWFEPSLPKWLAESPLFGGMMASGSPVGTPVYIPKAKKSGSNLVAQFLRSDTNFLRRRKREVSDRETEGDDTRLFQVCIDLLLGVKI